MFISLVDLLKVLIGMLFLMIFLNVVRFGVMLRILVVLFGVIWKFVIILLKIRRLLCCWVILCSFWRNVVCWIRSLLLVGIGLMIIVVIFWLYLVKSKFNVVLLLSGRMVVCDVKVFGMFVDEGFLKVISFELVVISNWLEWLW